MAPPALSASEMRRHLLILLLAAGCQPAPAPTGLPHLSVYDPSLTLLQDSLYHHGQPFSGTTLARHPNGDSARLEAWQLGQRHGAQRQWYPNGQPMEARTYAHGQKTGIHRGWWANGHKRFEYHFTAGEHNGPLHEWYENGSPLRAFHHRMGYEDGQQRMWWPDGSQRANYTVRHGRRYGLLGQKLCSNPLDSLP